MPCHKWRRGDGDGAWFFDVPVPEYFEKSLDFIAAYAIFHYDSPHRYLYSKNNEYARRGRDGNLWVCWADIYVYGYGDYYPVRCFGSNAAFCSPGLPIPAV